MALLHEDVYPEYFETYISKVEEPDLLMALLKNKQSTEKLYRGVSAEMEDHRYADGKWSIKEVLQHTMDTERVMAYRALRFARNDKTAGFYQRFFVSGWRDSNPRPRRPERRALPDCATSRCREIITQLTFFIKLIDWVYQ